MTQDSKNEVYLNRLQQRFDSAIRTTFAFLEEAGFNHCPVEARELHEYRDAEFRAVYVRGSVAVRVVLGLSNRQIAVGVFVYDSEVQCDEKKKALRVTNLDHWIEQHGPIAPPPLPWMKTQTFDQEVLKNHRRFFKHVDEDLEAAVEFMAQRLQNSGLYKTGQ